MDIIYVQKFKQVEKWSKNVILHDLMTGKV